MTKRTNKSNTIELVNIGPIPQAAFNYPPDGGLVVLKGKNGIGKSTALAAIECAATGKGKLDVRDGELRGEVRAFGATLTVAQSTRRRGEVDVLTMEGRDVSSLVDPGLKSAEAADAHRIRALLGVVGAKVDQSSFWTLFPSKDDFDKIVAPKSIDTDDPVLMADRIKRDIEVHARAAEGDVERCQSAARGYLAQNDGIDTTIETDPNVLANGYAACRIRVVTVERAVEDYRNAVGARKDAKQRLASLDAPTVPLDSLAAIVEHNRAAVATIDELIRELKDRLEVANRQRFEAVQRHGEAAHALELATERAARVADLRRTVDRELPQEVSDVDVELAKVDAERARDAMERGTIAREALSRVERARNELEAAGEHARRAELYRNAARSTDEVLSGLVGKANKRLRVEAGRLVIDTGRGKTYFADLSDGERWKLALDVAIDAVGRGGVLVCPQVAFEGLDPSNRELIRRHLEGTGVVMFTAEATDDATIVVDDGTTPNGRPAASVEVAGSV